jgi:Lrp/AsnC family transcriptional regulator, regulator for asnA, asnC and gidA
MIMKIGADPRNPSSNGLLAADSLAKRLRNAHSGDMPRQERLVRSATGISLDEVSKAIIEQLQQDGRRAYAAIGKAVGLSEAAVRQRVQRLLDTGVMQIVAVTDPSQVGFPRQAMVGITVDGDIDVVAKELENVPEIEYIVITAGSHDLLVEVVCEDDEHLLEVINRRIRGIPSVRRTETFVYLKLRKQHYAWGTR